MSFGGGTRFPWFGMQAPGEWRREKERKSAEYRESKRSLHGYLPPDICEVCTLPDCRWCSSTRTCPMDSEYRARLDKRDARQKIYNARARGEII